MRFKKLDRDSPFRFVLVFLTLFLVFYYFNLLFFGISTPGHFYNAFLADHLNYISWLRYFLLHSSAQILNWLGFTAITSDYELLVVGRGTIKLVYSCLGLGVISFFSAFVLAYPKKPKAKWLFIISGILLIQVLNILRFVLLALYWNQQDGIILDHHTIFNITMYIIIAISLYFWVTHDDKNRIATTN
ncbi:MAG: archaeosortase/exosortase family protein [Mucilaginibacter sp.]